MKKILNSSFFGICFLASIIAEAYFIRIGTDNLFSVAGIGIVTLIVGYLLIDSIRSGINRRIEEVKFYLDQNHREDTEKRIERYTEESNLQKATYTAMKKNTIIMSQQFEEMTERLEALENNTSRALSMMIELQKKSLEGQKNALNLEINYNRDNTKQLIQALKEESSRMDTSELFTKILDRMEKYSELVEHQLDSMKNISFTVPKEHNAEESVITEDVVEIDWNDIADKEAENITTTEWDGDMGEPVVDNLTESGWDLDAELMLGNNITDGWEVAAEAKAPTEENAPEDELPIEAEPESEAVKIAEEMINSDEAEAPVESKSPVVPIYNDPNKSLSADEIAALFANYGQ